VEKAQIVQVAKSISYLQVTYDASKMKLVPQGYQCLKEEKVEAKVPEQEEQKDHEVQSQNNPQQQQLKNLQEELKGKISSGDLNIQEIVGKITTIQTYLKPPTDKE